jgi:alpha-L-rhamnosidase
MKRKLPIFCILYLFFITTGSIAQVKVTGLLTENRPNPIGLDLIIPRFSWQIQTDKRNVMQSAYEIKVMAGKAAMWSSAKVTSDQSVHVPYAGKALLLEKIFSQVRVWIIGKHQQEPLFPDSF